MLRTVRILGVSALCLGFLLLNQDSAVMFQALAEDTQRRYVGGEPLSDLIMVITLLAALASGMIMFFWPRFEPPKQQLVIRHYLMQGDAYQQTARQPLWAPILRYYVVAIANLRRVRAYLGFA